MPNQDGSLTGADEITLVQALNRMIPFDDGLAAGTLGMLDEVQQRATSDDQLRHAFMRVTEALSLDLLAQAVGGFAALTEQEQVTSLLSVENVLPEEFSVLLEAVREIYYDDDKTPEQPDNFEGDNEVFGKISIPVEEVLEPVSGKSRLIRRNRNSHSRSGATKRAHDGS